ncbi:MAG: tripartite tricarboxylate transporter permease [Bacillota bacterium]
MLEILSSALFFIFTPTTLLLITAGVFVGITAGALPGIGPPVAIAVLIPFTYVLSPNQAFALLVSVYSGGMYGGAVAAILLNAPGTGASAATTLDGYPMARNGQAQTALTIAAFASGIGGVISGSVLLFGIPLLKEFVLIFGTPEFFLLGILGIALIAVVSKESLIKGLIVGSFGLLITTVGMAPMDGQIRFTFGFYGLYGGIGFLPAIIGLFAVAEMMKLAGEEALGISKDMKLSGSIIEGVRIVLRNKFLTLRSAVIGLLVGTVPGAGGTTASFIVYSHLKSTAADSDSYGKGNPKGLIATESANNGVIGGALVPTLLFGIPGSSTAAVLLGGLLLHGVRPGLSLFTGDGIKIVYIIALTIIVGHILNFFLAIMSSGFFSKATTIRKEILIPIVLVVSSIGIYVLNGDFLDLILITFFGFIGYLMVYSKFPVIPLILAVILGGMIEGDLYRSLRIGGGSLAFLFSRPVSLILILFIISLLFSPWLKKLYGKVRSN